MPVTLVRSRWTSGSLEFFDPATDTVLMTIATTGVNIPAFTIDDLVLDAGATVDLNGIADSFILDADADTTISSPTDDQIDIEVSGADDFTITANSFNVLSGSVINFADAADAQFGTGDDAAVRWSTGDASNHSLVIALGDSNQALHLTDLAAVATDWNVAADTHPTFYAHSNTTPATDYMTFGAHDGTTGHINVVGGTTLSLDIAGTPEVTVTASGLVLASGNSISGEIVSFNGVTGANEIVLVTNLADALSIEDSAGDLIVFDTTTGNQVITITPAVTVTGVLTASAGVFDADLILNSTNEINLQIGGVSLLALDDGAISANAGATDTAGKDVFIETQDGGAASADTAGVDGGDWSLKAGDGSDGGAHTANNPNGGDGGNLTLTAGSGGASGGGTGVAGAPGAVAVASLFKFGAAQVIDMADAAVILTRVPGTPAGTLLTSNILRVDANSSGTEDLTLPPEADCAGVMLHIVNTGGESIVLKDDAAATVETIATATAQTVFCDGTAWTVSAIV